MIIVTIAIPIHVLQTFDYLLSSDIYIEIGVRVIVPFRKKKIIGIVISINKQSYVSEKKLKHINKIIDKKSLFPKKLWKTLIWASRYYHYPIGEVLFQSLPLLLRQGKSIDKISTLLKWFITESGKNKFLKNLIKIKKQKYALSILIKNPIYYNEIKKFKISKSSLQSLQSKKLCNLCTQKKNIYNWKNTFSIKTLSKFKLNTEQSIAVNSIFKKSNKFISWLLSGITGSGKTEVYIKIIEKFLLKGHQALVLVPEIGLIPQTKIHFKKRFNVPIEILHSKLNNKEKLSVWLKAKNNECAIVIGTRSALFTPFTKLGIIVIDEEHDSAYKQNKRWHYNARDLAVFLAKEENIPIILGTATPSIETLYNVKIKKYKQLNLDKRAGNAKCANQILLDIKKLPLKHGLSIPLINKMNEHLKNNNQVLLFLNKRGFAPALLCHECGWIAECYKCNRYYTLHKHLKKIYCHICNDKFLIPNKCKLCNSSHLIPIGLGTEQIEKALIALFPKTPITRIDRDTTIKKGSLEQYISKIKKDKSHILIGTQMLAKGHHFPNVTLVSLIDVDGALFSNDFRASERFAQLYIQVSGRAGRSKKIGEVLLQTHHPEHPLLKTLSRLGYMEFAKNTLKERFEASLPPFVSHALFKAYDKDNLCARLFLNQLHKQFILNSFYDNNLLFMGPMPALDPKRKGLFRWKLLLSHPSRLKLKKIISNFLPKINKISRLHKVKWSLDIDPIDS